MTWAAAKAAGALRESDVWWLKYRDARGVIVRESSGTEKHEDAKRLLRVREGAAAEGKPTTPRADKVTVAELAEDVRNDYRVNNERSSADRLEFSLQHILPFFGSRRAAQVTVADVRAYTAKRLEAKAANATVNRELAALKRLFSLAVKAEKLHRMPHIPMLRENNVRTGFFEREQFESVRHHLPEYLKPVVTVAYITGWRTRDELLPLQWRQVDFKAGTVRLEPGTTKNKEGRTFVMTPELRACLEAQRASTEALQIRTGSILPWVFHRNGRPVKGFTRAWRTACKKAGLPGRFPHDFRRTAVRNLERAGVPRSVAMKMIGHRTEAIYRRYAIVDEGMLREAAEKLALAENARQGKETGKVDGAASRRPSQLLDSMAGSTGVEPATSGLTVQCANQAAPRARIRNQLFSVGILPRSTRVRPEMCPERPSCGLEVASLTIA
jgi:integrase